MDRRRLLAIAASALLQAALPGCAREQDKVYRIGFINSGPAALNADNVSAFREGLRELGYVEGRNLIIDFRWGEQKFDRLTGLVNELLSLKPDVIFSTGGPPTIRAVRAATRTVPVVFITGDPVEEKIVTNLARPGENLTGFAVLAQALDAKRIQLLKDALPNVARVAVLWNPNTPFSAESIADAEAAATRAGIKLQTFAAHDAHEVDRAFAAIDAARPDALLVIADPVLGFERSRIVEYATRRSLPGIYFWREFAEIGGLMSYGTNLTAMYRHAAIYIDKILKGAKPGDLPIEQPTTFELVINLKTAKALGIAIPQSLLLRADQVIQ